MRPAGARNWNGEIAVSRGFKSIDDLDVRGKRVLVRADLNVPVKSGRVTDSTRIDRTAITLKELLGRGARVVLLAHFGRPDGKRVPEMSLRPVLEPLSKALGGKPVAFAEDCIGDPARKAVAALKDGEIVLLENLRYHAAEEKNDPLFARELASLGDLYVNDAFSCAHRAHASTEAIARLLPSAAGRLMEAELDHLSKALENPARPVAAIVGGAKISTKLDLLGNLVKKVDLLVIGGAMANTFLAAQGVEIGASLAERDMAETARQILLTARTEHCEILLPTDVVVAADLKPNLPTKTSGCRRSWHGGQDIRHRPGDCKGDQRSACNLPHAGLERPGRRLRDAPLRSRHRRHRQGGGETDGGRQAPHGRRRRRYGGGAGPSRRRGEILLRLHRRRRVSRMAGRQGPAGGRGAEGVVR